MPTFPSAEWVEAATARLNDDPQFGRYARHVHSTVRIDFGETAYALVVDEGRIDAVHEKPTLVAWDYAIRGSAETWSKLLAEVPPPVYSDPYGAWLHGDLVMEGDLLRVMREMRPVKRMVQLFRATSLPGDEADTQPNEPALPGHGEHEPSYGRYVWIEFEGRRYRTFYEAAGHGDVPLVCLHTAGADSRQFRHLMTDDAFLDRFTLYAFDMPWHGRTYPPMDGAWWTEEYALTTDFYAGFVVRFTEALGLNAPVVLGCSMGGAIVLELAAEYAEDLRGVVGLETTAFAPKREFDYFSRLDVDQEAVRPEWAYGFHAPESPERAKRENWWIYSQAGHGAFVGDLHFYGEDWDARDDLERIDTEACEVILLTGEYDFSATPEDTRAVADAIDGAHHTVMDGIGHFPMTENPERFRERILPLLDDAFDL